MTASLLPCTCCKTIRLLALLLALFLLTGCTGLTGDDLPTPLPVGYLPTAAALTLEASGIQLPSPTAPVATQKLQIISTNDITPTLTSVELRVSTSPTSQKAQNSSTPTRTPRPTRTPTFTPTPKPTRTPAPTPTMTRTPTITPTATPFQITLPPPPTLTPPPEIPDARVQIYRYGELSRVTSPLRVTADLSSKVGKIVRIELYGEDGRLLARQLKTYYVIPWTSAKLTVDLDFEISAAAEVGRLVVSVEDQFGRIMDVNSVNLILLSQGSTELTPPSALLETIVINEPNPRSLIQGGTLLVSGLARTNPDQPLRVALITEEGKVIGQRLAKVDIPVPGGYGTFFAEVPYSVEAVISARLVVYEEGYPISPYSHLSSIVIVLSP